jgi:hypothetical protein
MGVVAEKVVTRRWIDDESDYCMESCCQAYGIGRAPKMDRYPGLVELFVVK